MVQRRRCGGYGWRNRATEDNVFGHWRYTQRAGVCAKIKRGARRRERREAKVEIRATLMNER
jgi:hypothetical protein